MAIDSGRTIRASVGVGCAPLLALLVAINAAAWTYALITFHQAPLLLGTALLAWSLGLRHAVDADHIAAIDNVTRKLMHEGKRTETVGLFFSLGHSSVVFLASLAVALGVLELRRGTEIQLVGGLLGTALSATFLLLIAMANSLVLSRIWRAWRLVKAGQHVEGEIDGTASGPMAHLLRRVFGLIRTSWHMLPLGFLFGLGFDTATEIALLAISASAASHGVATASILIFPILFAAGMILIDTLDSILMTNAYGWALANPARKLTYNMAVTLISVVVALLISGIEILGLASDKLKLTTGFWSVMAGLGNHMPLLGCSLIALFAVAWLVALLSQRVEKQRAAINVPATV
ncbi:MAG TPA: HoxN/HupN/NixA family nickel/cobalt transporter [Rhizomicrobium sp.]|jgi:high-affinity nickel-transport protein|nr:HoxN/HupN/NixA family nickel/cobalt transporter [Rhizomicrobium sp.]